MKNRLLFLLLAIACPLAGFSQRTFVLADLSFHSEFEKQAISQADPTQTHDVSNILALLMAGDPANGQAELQSAQQKINRIIQDLESEDIAGKKLKKSAKIIFDHVHTYLRRYDTDAVFDQILKDGTYNCLTASALYALILEHFKIPYALIEMPTHVFVLLDPGGENIGLETTNPVAGVFKLDKNKIVAELRQQKMVADADFQNKTAEEVYDDYFQASQIKINLYQLVGLAYHNLAVDQHDAKAYLASAAYTEKSVFFYPGTERGQLRQLSFMLLIKDITHEKPENYYPFFELLDYPEMQKLINEQLPSVYEEIAKHYLISDFSQEKYNSFYHYFVQHLAAKKTSDKAIVYLHHIYQGMSYGLRRSYAKSLLELDTAYQMKSGSLQLQAMMTEGIMRTMQSERHWAAPNTDSLIAKYPFLKEEEQFLQIHCYRKMEPVMTLFDDNKDAEGFAAVAASEASLEQIKGSLEYNLSIEMLYGIVFRHFVKKDDYRQGQIWLNKGLELVPGSEVFLHQMETVKDHLKIYGDDPAPGRPRKGKN